jgi:hypothetical protein
VLTAALAATAVMTGGTSANGALVIDVRAVNVIGPGTVVSPKRVEFVVPGSVILFDVLALVTDSNNANTSDQGILSVTGSFLIDGPWTQGNLVAHELRR